MNRRFARVLQGVGNPADLEHRELSVSFRMAHALDAERPIDRRDAFIAALEAIPTLCVEVERENHV